MSAAVRRLLRRPLLLFGLLLLGPAAGFVALGWESLLRERALRGREATADASDLLRARVQAEARDLEALRQREAARPYFAWQRLYAPEDMVLQQVGFQPSPLTQEPADPRVLAWFQWERTSKGVAPLPETFGSEAHAAADDLARVYGPVLRARLARADRLTDALPRAHALRAVLANEERGQLLEELEVVAQERSAGRRGGEAASTPYLESFYDRQGEEPLLVHYGPMAFLAGAAADGEPPLVLWRIVRIPATHLERREVTRERWVLQGVALDPARGLPTEERSGGVRLLRGLRADAPPPARALRASVLDVLAAERLGGRAASLERFAVADLAAGHAAWASSRDRFLLLVGGLVLVVGVGFAVLFRGVRREVALARRKQDFVAAVSHELKTPLAAIRMYAEMLREGWCDDEEAARRQAGRILEEGERLGHLVDQVLDLAALERGVVRAHAVPGDLATVIGEAVETLRPRAAPDVALRYEPEEGLPEVRFDPRLVRPLALNLVDNALRYGAPGGRGVVRVRLAREGAGVVLEVSDEGPGLDAAVRRHLFEPFQRGGDEMTRTTKGVGLGLALVKRYADAHDARVEVQSAPGRGTKIRVRFSYGA